MINFAGDGKLADESKASSAVREYLRNIPSALSGPGLATLDFSLFKKTQIPERVGLQFRAEIFNIPNHANFHSPSPIVFSGTAESTSAGVITTTTTTSRQIQFGLKLIF